jgi:SAM-dependent methyltransferase
LRDHVKQIVQLISQRTDLLEPILELGSLQVEGQVGYADLRPFFLGKRYIGCDFRAGPGVDRVENPEIGFSFEDGSIGTVISCDTFEHIYDIFKVIREIERVLSSGGVLVAVSVMYWPIHAHPYDYWRFTPECFRRLLGGFADAIVLSLGDKMFPHTVLGIARKKQTFPASFSESIQRDILRLPPHLGSAWKSPRERELEKQLQELLSQNPLLKS